MSTDLHEPIELSPDGESWFAYGPPEDRRRLGFHDYAGIYAVPGLYERLFVQELGMCSHREVVGLYAEVLAAEGLDPAQQRVVDLGAGNGMGGEQLRAAGVGAVVGLDLEPEAERAAARDRPGTYDDYVVGDLGTLTEAELEPLRVIAPTALLALSAIGVGHVPPALLDRALDLVGPGALFAFAVTPALMPGSDDEVGLGTGYPAFLEELLERRAEELGRREYVHRRQADGTPHHAVALIGRLR